MSATEILRNIATAMDADFQRLTGGRYGQLRYTAGYDSDISTEINKLATAHTAIYPLFAVCLPIRETATAESNVVEYEVPKIVICTSSAKHLSYEQRERLNYTPILNPLFRLFLQKLESSREVKTEYGRKVTATHVPYYSDGGANTYSDLIDGIVITNFKFRTKQNCRK